MQPNQTASPRCGMTVIELLVCVSIAAILFSLLLVGVQSARESSRRITCQSNIRQLCFSLINFVNVHNKLPENRYFPDSNEIRLWTAFCEELNTNSKTTSKLKTPSILICPTSPSPTRLSPISASPNGIVLPESYAETMDYVASAGVFSLPEIGVEPLSFARRAGFVPDLFRNQPKRGTGEVSGGFSNTLACWEVQGSHARYHYSDSVEVVREWVDETENLRIRDDMTHRETFELIDVSSTLRYRTSSSGIMRGYIGLFDQYFQPLTDPQTLFLNSYRVINVTNKYYSPYSPHKGIATCCMMDGSCRQVAADIDHLVAFALATVCADE